MNVQQNKSGFFYKILITSIACFLFHASYTQENKRVSQLFSTHCISCHQPGGNAPFSLLTYNAISQKSKMIEFVLKNNTMPPWIPDSHYSSFKYERVLTKNEKSTLLKWLRSSSRSENDIGMLTTTKDIKDVRDSIIIINSTRSKPVNTKTEEQDIISKLYLGNSDSLFIKKISLQYGNKDVHHSLVWYKSLTNDQDINSDVSLFGKKENILLTGILPGINNQAFDDSIGWSIAPDSYFLIDNHFPRRPYLIADSTSVILTLSKERPAHFIKNKYIDVGEKYANDSINNDSKKTFTYTFKVEDTIHIVSIIPHMHFRGKTFLAYIKTPDNKTIPLIKIDNWNFYKQEEYYLKNVLTVFPNAEIVVKACIDNRNSNHMNPEKPARTAYFGSKSTEEMIQLLIKYF